MPEQKVSVESGRFNWDAGRGYVAPANAPPGKPTGTPPGWGMPPHLQAPELPPMLPPHEEHPELLGGMAGPEPEKAPPDEFDIRTVAPSALEKELRNAVDEIFADVPLPPKERVNLDNNTAMFMGHVIELSKEASDVIKFTLATEIARTLREEEARVLSAVQFPELPGGSTAGRADVPEVPGPPSPVEQNAQSGAGAVQ